MAIKKLSPRGTPHLFGIYLQKYFWTIQPIALAIKCLHKESTHKRSCRRGKDVAYTLCLIVWIFLCDIILTLLLGGQNFLLSIDQFSIEYRFKPIFTMLFVIHSFLFVIMNWVIWWVEKLLIISLDVHYSYAYYIICNQNNCALGCIQLIMSKCRHGDSSIEIVSIDNCST